MVFSCIPAQLYACHTQSLSTVRNTTRNRIQSHVGLSISGLSARCCFDVTCDVIAVCAWYCVLYIYIYIYNTRFQSPPPYQYRVRLYVCERAARRRYGFAVQSAVRHLHLAGGGCGEK